MTQTELNLCFTLHRTRMALKACQQLLTRRGESSPVPDLSPPVQAEYQILEQILAEHNPALQNVPAEDETIQLEANRATHKESLSDNRCEECNGELSQCGPQGVDGEPSLDCKYCAMKQRAEKAEALQSEASAALRWAREMLVDYRTKLQKAERERDEANTAYNSGLAFIAAAQKERDQLRAENERMEKSLCKVARGMGWQGREAFRGLGLNLDNYDTITVAELEQALAAKGEPGTHPADCMCHLCIDNHPKGEKE